MPNRVVNVFAVFNMHLGKIYCSYITFSTEPLISTTIATSCPTIFINLFAILVELRMAEYGCKLMRFANCDKRGHPIRLQNSAKKRILRTMLQNFAQRVPIH